MMTHFDFFWVCTVCAAVLRIPVAVIFSGKNNDHREL